MPPQQTKRPLVGFFVRLPEDLVDEVRADARRSGRSLDSVAEIVLRDFLNAYGKRERRKFYATKNPKRMGRPLEAA